jgi:hypothetical protein
MSAGGDEGVGLLVCDTSAYVNGQHDHLPLATFPSVWIAVGAAIDAGRIVVPREVFRELLEQDDDVAAWIKEHSNVVLDPVEEVQVLAGQYYAAFPTQGSGMQLTPGSWPKPSTAPSRSSHTKGGPSEVSRRSGGIARYPASVSTSELTVARCRKPWRV